MTVSSDDARSGPYNGNASTTVFAYDFKILDQAHLVVTLTSSAGVEAVKTLTTHYTVSGVGGASGGNVTMVTAPASGEKLTITRSVPLTQLIDLQNRGGTQPSVLESAYDKLTQIVQDFNELYARVPRFPVSSAETSVELPLTLTPDTVLKVNAAGDGFENGPTTTQISDAETQATAAAASAALAAEWATKTTGQVASTDYAAKAWAIGGTGVTDTATAGAAKEWATAAEDDLVDGSEYSAKHYSAKASGFATNAETSATNAAASEAAAAAAAQGWADVVSITAGTTNIETTDANKYYIVDASGGAVTLNLPAVGTSDGLTLAFEVLDATNAITIVRDGTDTINGVASNYTSLTGVGDVVHFISIDGTPDNWSARLISRFVVDDVTIQQAGRTISVKDDGVGPEQVAGSVNAQTGTAYTAVLTDDHKIITMSNAAANTLTVPTNASVAFPVGAKLSIWMAGAGVTTITGDTGVTINGVSAGSGDLAQYGACSIVKTATDTWLAVGLTVA